MTAPDQPMVMKSLKPIEWPERLYGGKAVVRFPNGVESGNWYSKSDDMSEKTREYVRADIVQALTAERNKAVLGNHRFNEHEPTWAELTRDWKARAEAAETERDRLRELVREADELIGGDLTGLQWKRECRGFRVKARAALNGETP